MSDVKCTKCGHANSQDRLVCVRCGASLPKRVAQANESPGQAAAGGTRQRPSSVSFRRGQNVAGRYTVIDMIGRGGMGCIYLVHDNTLNERVALKTLLPQFASDKMVVDRFYNEARIARQLSHPNIVRVHDIGLAQEIMYISMEYLQGRSLRAILEGQMPGDRLPVRSALRIMDQLCASLEYAHDYTVHRDIKPENIMVLPDGSVKLMDFGISKLKATTRLTSTSVVMGTPQYMSPEQQQDSSSVDVRADIYSLGVVLYEALAGSLPTGVPKPASQIRREVPPALDPIIMKCVDPDPKQRYQTAKELRAALKPILELAEAGSNVTNVAPRGSGIRLEGFGIRRIIGVTLAVAVAVLAGAGLWVMEQRRPETPASSTIHEQNPATPGRSGDSGPSEGVFSERLSVARARAGRCGGRRRGEAGSPGNGR